jgi:hypothetical protein
MTGMSGPVEILEGGTAPSRGRRGLIGALAVLAVLTGVGWFRDQAVERGLEHTVRLATTFGVASSSTSPPGGSVRYFLVVRNDGPRPLSVTSVDAAIQGLRVRMADAGERRVDAGKEIEIPLSARLTCPAGGVGAARGELPATIAVRREDGGSATRHVALSPASLVLDVAATLCAVRPGLRDDELSGPVLRSR